MGWLLTLTLASASLNHSLTLWRPGPAQTDGNIIILKMTNQILTRKSHFNHTWLLNFSSNTLQCVVGSPPRWYLHLKSCSTSTLSANLKQKNTTKVWTLEYRVSFVNEKLIMSKYYNRSWVHIFPTRSRIAACLYWTPNQPPLVDQLFDRMWPQT